MNAPVTGFGFEEMKLEVGMRLQLCVTRGGIPEQHITTLVGYLAGRYVLVTVPFAHDMTALIDPGEEVEIRAFSGTHVFTFRATVDTLLRSPYYYMHLSYPKRVLGRQLRSAVRVPVTLPAQATPAAGTPQEAKLTNISTTGVGLVAHALLGGEGAQVGISFRFPSAVTRDEIAISAKMTIRSVQALAEDHPNAPRAYGLQFDALDPAALLSVQNLVYESIYAGRQGVA